MWDLQQLSCICTTRRFSVVNPAHMWPTYHGSNGPYFLRAEPEINPQFPHLLRSVLHSVPTPMWFSSIWRSKLLPLAGCVSDLSLEPRAAGDLRSQEKNNKLLWWQYPCMIEMMTWLKCKQHWFAVQQYTCWCWRNTVECFPETKSPHNPSWAAVKLNWYIINKVIFKVAFLSFLAPCVHHNVNVKPLDCL